LLDQSLEKIDLVQILAAIEEEERSRICSEESRESEDLQGQDLLLDSTDRNLNERPIASACRETVLSKPGRLAQSRGYLLNKFLELSEPWTKPTTLVRKMIMTSFASIVELERDLVRALTGPVVRA
jgi:hypothetical protein